MFKGLSFIILLMVFPTVDFAWQVHLGYKVYCIDRNLFSFVLNVERVIHNGCLYPMEYGFALTALDCIEVSAYILVLYVR